MGQPGERIERRFLDAMAGGTGATSASGARTNLAHVRENLKLASEHAEKYDLATLRASADSPGRKAALAVDVPVVPGTPEPIEADETSGPGELASGVDLVVSVGGVAKAATSFTVDTTTGIVPFRGWVRRLTGAERHSKRVAAAITPMMRAASSDSRKTMSAAANMGGAPGMCAYSATMVPCAAASFSWYSSTKP